MKASNGRPAPTSDDAQLRQIVSANADGIIVVDGDGVVRFINPAAAAILGRQSNDLIGQTFGFPVLKGERAEIDLLHPDGASQVAEMRVVDTEWEGGSALLISLRDITEHRRAQKALRDAEAFNWAILNSLNVQLAVLDDSGTIIAVNDAWLAFARENGDPELRHTGIGVNYFTVCQHATGQWSDEAPDVLSGMLDVLAGRRVAFELEYPCHSPDEERWFDLRVVPLRGERTGLLVSHTNVTEQRRISREAAEAEHLRERLRNLEREMRDVDLISRSATPTPRRISASPLRMRSGAAFGQAVIAYHELLDEALRCRAQQIPLPPAGPRELSERLGAHEAAPRDVIEVHLAAIRAATANAPNVRQQAYLEEGRLLALELMGHLAAYYRTRALRHDDDDPLSNQGNDGTHRG